MGALWVVCGSIRERNYRLKKKNYLSGPSNNYDLISLQALAGNYSELPLIRTSEMWPPLYSGHSEKVPKYAL